MLVAWFVIWVVWLRKEIAWLAFVRDSVDALDNCVELLRRQQLWRDRQRLSGRDVAADPSQFFDEIVQAKFQDQRRAMPPAAIQIHLKTIFVAGCDESLLETPELISETLQDIGRPSERLGLQPLLMLGFGALGTLFGLSRLSYQDFGAGHALYGALPPVLWGLVLSLAGTAVFVRFKVTVRSPCFLQIRRKTTTVWIPKLYPTVAQRAAQWATQTLQNAARVTDASEVIEDNTRKFVGAISDAKEASEIFSRAMQQFSHGIEASDQALVRAQSTLGTEVQKFAESLGRWTGFEDEMRRFYSSVETYQKQAVEQQKTMEYMLSTYRDFVREATGVLQKAASDLAAAGDTLPAATSQVISEMQAAHEQSMAELRNRLEQITAPVLGMEDRLRALGQPFERAAHDITEVATNLWKLNETFARDVSRKVTPS